MNRVAEEKAGKDRSKVERWKESDLSRSASGNFVFSEYVVLSEGRGSTPVTHHPPLSSVTSVLPPRIFPHFPRGPLFFRCALSGTRGYRGCCPSPGHSDGRLKEDGI